VRAAGLLLAALGLAAAASCDVVPAAESTAPRAVAARAARYLWSRQGADGGWHSETYGLLRSGQALTPFVLCALLEDPASAGLAPPGAVDRALAFLREKAGDGAALGFGDPDLTEYPNYATAYAIRCFVLAGRPEDRALVSWMADELVRRQYREESGFRPSDPAYGGWGFGAKQAPGVPGHMDLAHTRRVLEALRDAGRLDRDVLRRAERFLRTVQNLAPERLPAAESTDDGGFFFSPVVVAANKGARDGARFGSYATATSDGLLSLLAVGVPASDARVAAAREWLSRAEDADPPTGIAPEPTSPWGPALFFYHLAVRAEVERALSLPSRWSVRAARLLAPRQRPDGSFAGASALMKEDDPLLATTLALLAARAGSGPDSVTVRDRT
jgi:hypothetical protein